MSNTFNISGDGHNNQFGDGNTQNNTQTFEQSKVWEPVVELAKSPEQVDAVEVIREIVEMYPDSQEEVPESEKERFKTAISFLKTHGPAVLRIAGKVALSLPIAAPISVMMTSILEEI